MVSTTSVSGIGELPWPEFCSWFPHLALVTSPPSHYTTAVGKGLGSLAFSGLVFLALWALAPSLRAIRWSRFVRHLAGLSHERWVTGHRLTGCSSPQPSPTERIVDPVLHQSRFSGHVPDHRLQSA